MWDNVTFIDVYISNILLNNFLILFDFTVKFFSKTHKFLKFFWIKLQILFSVLRYAIAWCFGISFHWQIFTLFNKVITPFVKMKAFHKIWTLSLRTYVAVVVLHFHIKISYCLSILFFRGMLSSQHINGKENKDDIYSLAWVNWRVF